MIASAAASSWTIAPKPMGAAAAPVRGPGPHPVNQHKAAAAQLHDRDLGEASGEAGGSTRRGPPVHESVGGKLHGFWYAFGEYDAYNLWEAPDKVSMAAVAMAISGGGALSKYETTVLLTVEETMDAMARARNIRYRPPGT